MQVFLLNEKDRAAACNGSSGEKYQSHVHDCLFIVIYNDSVFYLTDLLKKGDSG